MQRQRIGRDRRRGAQPPRCHQPTECRRCRDVQRLGPDLAHPELAGGRPAYHRARRSGAAARARVRAWGAGLLAGLRRLVPEGVGHRVPALRACRCLVGAGRRSKPLRTAVRGAGFVRVDHAARRHDRNVSGRAAHPNHAGIYLADDPSLPGEDAQHFGAGPFLLHHLYGKPSEIIVFGGPWLDRMRLVLRYRELPNDAGRQSQSENPR
ncbi:hypothetical protein BANRA_05780 [Pseudomonas aeruginosa]|nr:hypothetical protein BANRA_05780 [Pseudomonas aeruginosa]